MATRALPPLWLRQPSRYAGMARGRARIALLLLIAAVLASFTALAAPGPPERHKTGTAAGKDADKSAADKDMADILLYQQIVEGMRAGGDYYTLAAAGQRNNDYPMRPFFTMRLPTLAAVLSLVPRRVAPVLLWALCGVMLIAWWVRSGTFLSGVRPRLILMALLGGGSMVMFDGTLLWFHEIWAGLLIAIALAVWRPGQWQAAAGLVLMAMLIRETAALIPVVMGGIALIERRRRETAGWAATLAVLAVAVACHYFAWARVVLPGDPTSQGWLGLLGFGFFVKVMTTVTALAVFPVWAGAPLVVLALFGWTALRDPVSWRVLGVLGAYTLLLAVFCRTDTFYWAMLVAAPLLPGLAFAFDGVRDLVTAATGRRRITVTRITT